MAGEDLTLKLILLGEDKSAGKSLSGVGKAAGVAFAVAGAAALKFGADSIQAFMEADREQAKLEDAYARFPALAGGNIDALRALNEEIQRKVGADADDIAGAQAVLAQYELNEDQLRRMTPLLVDYATKTGKDMPTAAGLLGKALMGNARALKDLGIDFKATGDRGADFDAIVGMLDAKVGGYADSIPEVEKKQKILQASFGDLQESVGEKLLPVVISLVESGQGVVDWATDNQEALIPVASAAGIAALGIGAVVLAAKGIETVKGTVATIKSIGAAMDGLTIKSRAAAVSAGAVGITLGVVAAVYAAFATRQAKITAGVEDYTAALEASNGALDENVRKTAAKNLMDEGAFTAAERLGLGVDIVTDAAIGNAAALEIVRSRLDEVRRAEADAIATTGSMDLSLTDAEQSVSALESALGLEAARLGEARTRQRQMETATRDATSATKNNTGATGENADAQGDLSDALADVYRNTLAVRGDHRAVEAAYDDARKAAKDYRDELIKKNQADGKSKAAAEAAADATIRSGAALDVNSAAGRRNQEALDRIASSALTVKGSMEQAGRSTEEVEAEMARARSQFIKAAGDMGVGTKAAKKLADELGLIKSKKATVEVNVKKTGISSIQAIPGKGHQLFTLKAYAAGGRPKVGELAIFHADELWVPDTAGTVLTKSRTQQLIGDGPSPIAASPTVVQAAAPAPTPVHLTITDDSLGGARKLYNALRDLNQANGGRGLTFA